MLKQYLSAFTKAPVLAAALLVALAIPFLTLPEITRASITNTRVDAFGTDELPGSDSSNMGGAGVDVYSNGSSAALQTPEVDNSANGVTTGAEWQCVELINRLYATKGWITTRWIGDGSTLVNNLPAGTTEQVYSAVTYVNAGDVITFSDTSGGAGHTVYVSSVSGSTVNVVSQNTQGVLWSLTWSGTTLSQTYLGSFYNVQAIVHHPTVLPTHKDLAWYDGSTLFGFKGTGYGTSATVTGYSQPYWAGAGQRAGTTDKEGLFYYLNNGAGGTTGTIYWIPGGSSNFASAISVRGGLGLPVWAGVGDFTGSGKRDSIAWYDGTTLYLFTGSSLGTVWSTTGYSTPKWAGVGDHDKDGKDDLFWYLNNGSGGTTGTIYALTSTGSGFNGAVSVRGGIGVPVWAGVGDFVGDKYRNDLAWYDGTTLWTFEGSSLGNPGPGVTGYTTPTWAGVGQWKSGDIKDKLFWDLNSGGSGTLYGIDDNGTDFTGATTLLGPGIGAPTWADTGNFY